MEKLGKRPTVPEIPNAFAAKAPAKVTDRFAPLAGPDESEETSAGPASQDIPSELLVKTSEGNRKGQRRERSQKLEDAHEEPYLYRHAKNIRIGLSLLRQRRMSGRIGTQYISKPPRSGKSHIELQMILHCQRIISRKTRRTPVWAFEDGFSSKENCKTSSCRRTIGTA